MTQTYDIIIIGAGPSGLTAGIYASRIGLKTLILEENFPGSRVSVVNVENFPGFVDGISGRELTQRMIKQAEKFGVKLNFPEGVVNLSVSGKTKGVTTNKESYNALSLIIATGAQRKKLLVPGEIEFLGKGVSYCPICDGPFFKDLRVTVIGSGDEAANDALFLTKIAKRVTIISSTKEVEISKALKAELKKYDNLKIIPNSKVKAIEGDSTVNSIQFIDIETSKESKAPTDGVFVSLGRVPLTNIVQKSGIEVDKSGCIQVDRKQRTNIEGVFAAGDCTCGGMQIVTAAGEGATAAIKASIYIKQKMR